MNKIHQQIIEELNSCAAECNHCYQSCLNEEDVNMMTRCIELNRDCADICQLTASLLARDSEHAHHLLKECGEVCNACAEECSKHENEHCKQCADACKKCADLCNQHLQSIKAH